jgi:hypothetical protein
MAHILVGCFFLLLIFIGVPMLFIIGLIYFINYISNKYITPQEIITYTPALTQKKHRPNMSEKQLTSTEIGKLLNTSSRAINKHLADIGMIAQTNEGWTLTQYGQSNGGMQKKHPQSGNLYVVWTEKLLQNPDIKMLSGEVNTAETQNVKEQDFRSKFPAKLRTVDGHYVRSRAELLIDNWLYSAGIVHAYEKKLPIEEEVYSDFYIPAGKLYIEFWGLENDPKYIDRKNTKIEIYRKYNFSLLEIRNENLENIDDELPQKLLKFGIKTY